MTTTWAILLFIAGLALGAGTTAMLYFLHRVRSADGVGVAGSAGVVGITDDDTGDAGVFTDTDDAGITDDADVFDHTANGGTDGGVGRALPTPSGPPAVLPSTPENVAVQDTRGLPPRAAGLLTVVAQHTGVSVVTLCGRDRSMPVVRARHVAAWLLIQGDYSLTHVGRILGGRDHSTILASRERVDEWMLNNEAIARRVDAMLAEARGRGLLPRATSE